jgi:hypothetical protein
MYKFIGGAFVLFLLIYAGTSLANCVDTESGCSYNGDTGSEYCINDGADFYCSSDPDVSLYCYWNPVQRNYVDAVFYSEPQDDLIALDYNLCLGRSTREQVFCKGKIYGSGGGAGGRPRIDVFSMSQDGDCETLDWGDTPDGDIVEGWSQVMYSVNTRSIAPSVCEDDDYCKGFGSTWICIESGYCRLVSCTIDSECPFNHACVQGICQSIFDSNYDNDNFNAVGPNIDCNDLSAVCNIPVDDPACDNADDGSGGFQDADIQDCMDPCFDVDGDGYCSERSVLLTEDEYNALPNQDAYREAVANLSNIFDSWDNPTFTAYWLAVFSSRMSPESSEEFKTFFSENHLFDCDDSNNEISPNAQEACDLINNDCDAEVDECSKYVPGVSEQNSVIDVIDSSDVHINTQVSPGDVLQTNDNQITENPEVSAGSAAESFTVTHTSTGPSVSTPRQCVYNSRSGNNLQCQVYDWDGDGFSNFEFNCPDCYDCNDDDPTSNPGALDTSTVSGDQNCNGVADEMNNADFDDFYDDWDVCPSQDENFGESVDNNGCWYSNINSNLENWV